MHWIFCILPFYTTTCPKELPLTVFSLCEIKMACMLEAAGIKEIQGGIGIMSETVISVSHLKKYYKEVHAVDDVSFQVKRGELFGFLGINGAGKSTTINILCTLTQPTAGEAEICGFRLGQEDAQIRRKIGVVYQGNCLDDRLTVGENLMLRGALYEKSKSRLKSQVLDVCELLELGGIYDRRFATLSGGQKRRCEIARALVHTPELLFLDEPTTGLDPAARKKIWQKIGTLQKETNMTVFLTTHYMEEAARAANIAIIDGGQIKEQGTPYLLKERYVKDRLLLIARAGQEERFWQLLAEKNIPNRRRDEAAAIELENSLLALPILRQLEPVLEGFELVQGSMDDVFLNVTGKALTQEEAVEKD